MQEGGAFGPWTREQVELFCVDHLLMVRSFVKAMTFDFVFPTNVGNIGFGDDVQLSSLVQSRCTDCSRNLIGFKWEEDALGRSKQKLPQCTSLHTNLSYEYRETR
jgi:hypothetical protein